MLTQLENMDVFASSQMRFISTSLLRQNYKNNLKLVRHISENMFNVLKEHNEAHKIKMKHRYCTQFPKEVQQLPKFF